MTLDTKKQSLRNPERVLDERDPLWSSLDNLTAGMSAQERASYLMSAVKEMTKSGQASEQPFNPIEDAMKQHPTLTREKALEMAKEFGY
jgi:hypothetical protein